MSTAITIALVLLALLSTFAAGLELGHGHDRRAVKGLLLVNVVGLPALAWLLMHLTRPLPEVRQAVWLVALAPGGASAPLLARSAGGAPTTTGVSFVALCVTSAVLVPLGLAALELTLPGWPLVGVIIVQLTPLLTGAALARRVTVSARLPARLRTVGNVLLLVVITLLTIDRGPHLLTLGFSTLGVLASFVALSATAGAVAGRPRAPLSMLTLVRNLTLTLLVCETLEPGGVPTLVVASYGLLMYAAAGVLLLFARRVATDGNEAAANA